MSGKVVKGWRLKPGSLKWANSPDSPLILEATQFSVTLFEAPTLAVLMAFKLSQPLISAYIRATFTITTGGQSMKGGLTHAFDYPYILEKNAPYTPTTDDQVYHWGLFEIFPLEAVPLPATSVTTASVYNELGVIVGAIDYELTIEETE